jgi:hypothetical protein
MNQQEELATLAALIHDLRKHKSSPSPNWRKIERSVGFLSKWSAACRARPWRI